MGEMIDRIARVMALDRDVSWQNMPRDEKDSWRSTACEVLAAMKEPTEAMLNVGQVCDVYDTSRGMNNDVWKAMILRALNNG